MARGNAVEVELKYLGADLDGVRGRLRELGARLEGPRALETNTVFDDEAGSLARSGRLLRLRNGHELTVKTPVEDAKYKARAEHTIHVEDGETDAILAGLGFRAAWRYEKYREGWDLEGMFVTLDELPFVGSVVEIEGARENIDATAERLGLAGLPTSAASYRELYDTLIAERGLAPGDMTFDAEARTLSRG